MHSLAHAPGTSQPETQHAQALLGDRVLLAAAALSTAAAAALGVHYGEIDIALGIGLPLFGISLLAYVLLRGGLASRLLLTTAQAALVALHIQLAHGMVEYHFGVFVTLALLLVYRDWRPIVLAAALFAIHHILFDRLQAAGFGVFCTTQADFPRVILHAVYVVIQTSLEVLMAVGMQRMGREGQELGQLLSAVDRTDGIHLDVAHIACATPAGQAMKSALTRMQNAVLTVRESVTHIERAGGEIASGNQDLGERTAQQASLLEETTALMGQLNHSVHRNADNANVASRLAADASRVATEGGSVVARVVETMKDINESSGRIADIIGVIDGIAFQTNILALNAAVEAARAGEQGRGFAVVAGEVRALARRSAESARTIKELIMNSVERTEQGAQLVEQAGGTMTGIVDAIRKVAELMDEISTASREQSTDVARASEAVVQMDKAVHQNSALVEESAAAAVSMQTQADHLMQAVEVFKLDTPHRSPYPSAA